MTENLVNASQRTLGEDQMDVGPLSYGLWRFTNPDIDQAQLRIETALHAGMNLVDAADVYGFDWGGTGFGSVEELLGKVLAQAPELRDQMVLATKGGISPGVPYDASPRYLRGACEASLRRLGTETIDIYLIHRPDLFAHPHDVAQTLTELRSGGKVREVGVSNHTPAQISALQHYLDFPVVVSQIEYSATCLDPLRDGSFDQALQHDIVPMAWSPLGGGSLATGDGVSAELLETLDGLSQRESVDRSIIALAFVLAHPSAPVCVIGTQNVDRIVASRAALDVHLDRTDVYNIVQASEGIALP
ncbi:MAG: aldo/keto reductase family oxidoreductase [Acidimicrobiales bacterium]